MSISLTDAAVARVQQFLPEGSVGLRLGVRKTGCSGWAYEIDEAREVRADDQVFEDRGVKVVVDATSLPLVDGTEIDFRREGLSAVFTFRNPNAVGECGCGESFSTERGADF